MKGNGGRERVYIMDFGNNESAASKEEKAPVMRSWPAPNVRNCDVSWWYCHERENFEAICRRLTGERVIFGSNMQNWRVKALQSLRSQGGSVPLALTTGSNLGGKNNSRVPYYWSIVAER
jgi:hypothetical protein